MYSSPKYVNHTSYQSQMQIRSELVSHSLSQPTTSHHTHPQGDISQVIPSSDNMPLLTIPHPQSTVQPTSLHPNDQRNSKSEDTGTWRIVNLQTAKSLTIAWWVRYPPTTDSLHSWTKLKSTHPPIA